MVQMGQVEGHRWLCSMITAILIKKGSWAGLIHRDPVVLPGTTNGGSKHESRYNAVHRVSPLLSCHFHITINAVQDTISLLEAFVGRIGTRPVCCCDM